MKTMEEDHYNQYVYFKSFLSDLNDSNLYDDAIVNQVTDVLLTTFQTSGLRSVNHGRQKARLLTITISRKILLKCKLIYRIGPSFSQMAC